MTRIGRMFNSQLSFNTHSGVGIRVWALWQSLRRQEEADTQVLYWLDNIIQMVYLRIMSSNVTQPMKEKTKSLPKSSSALPCKWQVNDHKQAARGGCPGHGVKHHPRLSDLPFLSTGGWWALGLLFLPSLHLFKLFCGGSVSSGHGRGHGRHIQQWICLYSEVQTHKSYRRCTNFLSPSH